MGNTIFNSIKRERLIELLDGLIEHLLVGEKLSDVIRNLYRAGFTREELVAFNFSESDIEDALMDEDFEEDE